MLWIKAKHVNSDIQMQSFDRVLCKKTAQVPFQLLMLKRDVQVGKFYIFKINIELPLFIAIDFQNI